jgi:hypothetical protein
MMNAFQLISLSPSRIASQSSSTIVTMLMPMHRPRRPPIVEKKSTLSTNARVQFLQHEFDPFLGVKFGYLKNVTCMLHT